MTFYETGRLLRRAELLAAGTLNDQTVRTGLKSGALERRCAGVYVPPSDDLSKDDVYLERVHARAGKSRVRVISHDSAAAVHNLALLDQDYQRVHLTDRRGGRITHDLHLHEAEFEAGDITVVEGHRVTSIARTLADVAREGTFFEALAVCDSGLRSGLPQSGLDEMADRFRGFVGGATLRDAVSLADGQAANPGESLSRGLMRSFPEVPTPRLQHPFYDDEGLIGYGDFDWDGRVVGEFDGLHKYRKYLQPGESIEDAVIREKRREDRLRALGIHVVRWTWKDLQDAVRFRALLAKGLRMAGML
ncbi:type IV toxin-antitoxin system AbiEi family antitoxin domain-containing protein [Williamsia soli]|uniref:type IV toxin-antitoxin system AbiEi family antitoxin domain-containing protein n=1 Tax=Williamsia soli TaxID=364929 RepID=UPI001A9DD45C|nr:hypothetical protein [Williamsia soli]